MTIIVEGLGNVDLRLQGLSGQPGLGVRRLVAVLDVACRPLPDRTIVILALTADLAVTAGTAGLRPLGAGSFTSPVLLGSVRPTVGLVVDLTDGQVEQIEGLRDGGRLELVVDVSGVAHHPDGHTDPVTGQYQLPIDPERWTEALDQAGAIHTATVTLLLPNSGPGRDRPKVALALREARQALADGRWSAAVSGCRQTLELAGFTTHELKASRDRSKDERYDALAGALLALYGVGSAAVHQDDVTSGFQWGRPDAVAAVACTVALLHQHGAATAPHDGRT